MCHTLCIHRANPRKEGFVYLCLCSRVLAMLPGKVSGNSLANGLKSYVGLTWPGRRRLGLMPVLELCSLSCMVQSDLECNTLENMS